MHGTLLYLALAIVAADPKPAPNMPNVVDPRLKIELVAAEPDIVTPCGLAVDAQGRVLAVESHTHFRPAGYQGPATDRIRMFEDTNGDGRADRISTFFEGTTWTMNIGVHPDGGVYVATRSEIFRLRDTDGDGRADQRTRIAHLETEGDYPHNGLSGFAFDFDGNVYFGLGENKGQPFKLIGTDGSLYSELEGGQIYRCRADGSALQLVAIGYWNPFHVALDTFGRLFAVDNDPDSMPPCRLMHIVPGGNYGYRYRNGRKGVHPFTAWNGELPGTLPMVAGTGEAPSGVLAYESDNLPADYVGELLATSWGDHRIDRFHLERRGASFRSVGVPIITGDENFRPVGIAAAPDGALFITDWVSKSYDVHGQGRIWRISARDARQAERSTAPAEAIRSAHRPLREKAAQQLAADPKQGRPLLEKLAVEDLAPRVRAVAVMALARIGDLGPIRKVAAHDASPDVQALAVRSLPAGSVSESELAESQPAEVRAEALRQIADPDQADQLWKHVGDPDAFIALAAREGLRRSGVVSAAIDLSKQAAAERLATLLILREARIDGGAALLPRFLKDPDGAVRFAAIQWVGEERLAEYREPLADALAAGPATGRLFAGYLAALERLDGVRREPHDEWAGDQYVARALDDPKTSLDVRRWALRTLRPDHAWLTMARLRELIDGPDPVMAIEAVRTLRESSHAERTALLASIAASDRYPVNLRAEAVVGLGCDDAPSRAILLELAGASDRALRNEALRSLRGGQFSSAERDTLSRLSQTDDETAEMVRRLLDPKSIAPLPPVNDLAAWLKLVDEKSAPRQGDAAAGQRIFAHVKSAACARCHQIAGRGARIGPELSTTATALTRERLLESIVRPSKEIAPQFATWLVVTRDGKSLTGMIVKEEATGEQTYADATGKLVVLKPEEIETRRLLETSIMPDGLPELLSPQELRDLLAFLKSAREGLNECLVADSKEKFGAQAGFSR